MKQDIWAILLHLGTNSWRKKGHTSINKKDEEDSIFREELYCDDETWRKVTDFLPSCGINTLLIDVADGVQYERHPEITIKGAWSREKLKAELARLREMGITPIPKCNFSCGHNAWMKDYAYMVGTEAYDRFCKDIVEELIELFDVPEFIHLGLEEEDVVSQQSHPIAIIRSPGKKAEDAETLFEVCRAHGVRPWIWCDPGTVKAFGGDEAFQAAIGKDVLISAWYYGRIRERPDVREISPAADLYCKLAEWGYEQVPTGSTWSWHLNNKDTMRFCKNNVDPKSIRGYMTAPWIFTVPKKYYALLNDAFNFGNAKKDIYGE